MIDQLRPWAELLYFGSGIVVAIAVVLGLEQVKLLKRDIRLRNERAAKESAIENARAYLSAYVRLQGIFSAEYQEKNLGPYAGPIGDFTSRSIKQHAAAFAFARKRFTLMSWLAAMNELEALSAAFTSGVADEATGFKIIGRTFCRSVESMYDIIALSRDKAETAQGYWSNIVQLYGMWSPRLEEAELRQAKEHLDTRIAVLGAQASGVTPIGLE